MTALEPPATACLERTRSAVLNVLVAVGAGIAASGLALGKRDRGALLLPDHQVDRWLNLGLFLLIAASFLVRRIGGSRSRLSDPSQRASRFYWAHVVSALIGALEIPLGFLYGWAIRPRFDTVIPFWVAGLALGALAYPRASELEGFEEPMPAEATGERSS